MSTRKIPTGGGRGTNQFRIKGRAKEKQAKPKAVSQLLPEPSRPTEARFGLRTLEQRREDLKDLARGQKHQPEVVLRWAWTKAHPGEPLPKAWREAAKAGDEYVPDSLTLYWAEFYYLDGQGPALDPIDGEAYWEPDSEHWWAIQRGPSGDQIWLRDGFMHRDNDQPAYIGHDGSMAYYVDGYLIRNVEVGQDDLTSGGTVSA